MAVAMAVAVAVAALAADGVGGGGGVRGRSDADMTLDSRHAARPATAARQKWTQKTQKYFRETSNPLTLLTIHVRQVGKRVIPVSC